jgi:sulfite reductase (ferredoxin)
VPAAEIVRTAEAVIRLFRDHGNRSDRKRARIKYLVHDWGVQRFRETLSGYVGKALTPPQHVEVTGFGLYHGWHPQGDGKWWYGLSVESGRIKDEGSLRLRTCLRSLIEGLRPEIRLTPMQDILLCNLQGSQLSLIEKTLADHGVRRPQEISPIRRHSLACPAIPTCGLAISESERALPGIVDSLERELQSLGLENEVLGVRMTGCPNGCVRPYQSDIGIVGRSGDKYTLFVGGNTLGNRLNFELADLLPRASLVSELRPLFQQFKAERIADEGFGDWCHRKGAQALREIIKQSRTSQASA